MHLIPRALPRAEEQVGLSARIQRTTPQHSIGLKRKNQRVRLAEWQEMLSFAEACENDFDRWIYVLKNMETFNRLPWMAKDSVFHRLSEIADVSAMTHTLSQYHF